MTSHNIERKLAAILSADVKGYSRLMGEDEVATIRTLTSYREVMASLIRQHRGRVVDSPGDNLLAEFGSVVAAVQCAVEIQQELKARNAEISDRQKMEFRIGVNLGDVIVEGERIYGDGVNIAARLEGLAQGGGICISESVYDNVENKLNLRYKHLGEHAVKNIAKSVRVYTVQMVDRAAGSDASSSSSSPGNPSDEKRLLEFPDKPSLAVLPFDNMSNDPEQEYFSDGITEDLITDLSKVSGLFVIARNSVFTYKGKPVRLEQVSQDLGVRYVLEGSVRKAKNRVRINAQLIDATTRFHVWADRFDGDLEDIFALQDKITQAIVAELKVKLTYNEQQRLSQKCTNNLEAYDYYLRGVEFLRQETKGSIIQAREMFEQATLLDPQFAGAFALLGRTYWVEWAFQWSRDPQTLDQVPTLAKKAIALDDSLSLPHWVLSYSYLWKGQHELAIVEAKKALEVDSNDADAASQLASTLIFAGRPEEAISLLQHAIRLNPHYPSWYFMRLGFAYRLMGKYEEGVANQKRALSFNLDFFAVHLELAVLYAELGREEEARAEGAIIQQISPQFTLEIAANRFPYKDRALLERLVDRLRKAGLQ